MAKGTCKLCGKNPAVGKHHVVPKSITMKINPSSSLLNQKVALCEECHEKVHYHFLTHLMMNRKLSVYNKYEAIKYLVLMNFLKKNYAEVYSACKAHWTDIIKREIEDFKEKEDEEWNT